MVDAWNRQCIWFIVDSKIIDENWVVADPEIINAIYIAIDLEIISNDWIISGFTSFPIG